MAAFDNFFDQMNERLEKHVQAHLQNVYTAMGVSLLVFAAGGYLSVVMQMVSLAVVIVGGVAALVTMSGLFLTPSNDEYFLTRFGLLTVFSFLMGVTMGPLLTIAAIINPNLIVTAFLATSLIFICFSLCALLTRDRKWLAIGGCLGSALSWLVLFGFLNLFLKSEFLFQVDLYVGLVVMCGYVLYDTQLIVERCRQGDNDFIKHCVHLFLDFINIFVKLLIILTRKEVTREESPRRDSRRRD